MKKIRDRLGESLGNKAMPKAIQAPSNPQDDYETQGHLRTLMDAEAIKGDPEKMKKVHKLAGRHSKQIKSIQDLKDTLDQKFGKGALKKGADSDADDESM